MILSQVPQIALLHPNFGLRPAFSASWRIVKFSDAIHVAVTWDFVKVTAAVPVSSMSRMVRWRDRMVMSREGRRWSWEVARYEGSAGSEER